jgi:hypothetical protein
VVDSHEPLKPTGVSPATARKLVDERTIHPVNRPLNSVMGQVYSAVAECDRPRHEVYVLTDLARSSWIPDQPAEGLDQVSKAKTSPGGKLATFVLRLGSQEHVDVSIDSAEPASSIVTQGEPVEIKGLVHAQGDKTANRVVEFYLDGVKKGEKPVELTPGAQVEVSFTTPPKLQEGDIIHRGELKLSGTPDPLEFNDRRYFTFKVRPAYKVLLISDQASDAEFVAAALDPDAQGAPKTFQVARVKPAEFAARYRDTLKEQAAVFLLNVEQLDEESWGMLNGYVHEGGGLVVGLGDRCRAENYNGPTASQLLPAQLQEPHTAKAESTFGKIADVTHPLFQRFAKEFEAQFALIPVYRYWVVKPPEASRALLSFSDGAPALFERSFKGAKTGRVLLWTTPLARRAVRTERGAWNELPLFTYWVFPVVTYLTVPYLAGASNEQLNFEAGENALLTLGPGVRSQSFLVTGPDQKTTESLTPSANSEDLQIIAPQLLGQWTVTAKDAADRQTKLGFSLNPPKTESQFVPLQPSELDAIFGKDGYSLAQDTKQLKDITQVIHVGHEIFPWLMMLILLIVTLENFLANTFYKESARPAPAGAAA